jgi:hypothetical protein
MRMSKPTTREVQPYLSGVVGWVPPYELAEKLAGWK